MHRRSSKLLDYTANSSGLLELRTEYDTGLQQGDRVFIVGESSLDIFTDAHEAAFDPFNQYSGGYEVSSVNTTNNSVVINYPYSAGVTIGESHIGTVYQASGHVSYGLIYNACVGASGKDAKIKYGNSTVAPVYASVFNTPMNTAYVNWLGGTFSSGRWSELSVTAPTSTVKYTMAGAIPVPVSVGANNNGLGYSWFRDGVFGNTDNAQPVKFANGTMYNADWLSGMITAGLVDGERGRVVVTDMEAYGGTMVGCIVNGGNIYGGTHYGAREVMPTDVAFDTFPSPSSIIVTFGSEADISSYANGDKLSIHVQKMPVTPAAPAPGMMVDTLIDYYNHISDTVVGANITIDTGTNTYTIEIDIPDWLDTTVPIPFSPGRFYVTKGSVNNVSASNATFVMTYLDGSASTDVVVLGSVLNSTLVGKAVVYNSSLNPGLTEQSKLLTGGLVQSCSVNRLEAIDGRVVGGLTAFSDIKGGIWSGISMRLSNIVSGIKAEALFVSGQFIDSYRDANVQWESVAYVSGNWYGYSGLPTLLTNSTLVYTDWYPSAAPGGLAYAIASANYGSWSNIVGPYNVSSTYYSPDVGTVLGIQVIDDITSTVYTERVVVDGNYKTQVDDTNTAISSALPLPAYVNNVSPTGTTTNMLVNSRTRYIKYDSVPVDPTGYVLATKLLIGLTEYDPGAVVIGSPAAANLKLSIDVTNPSTCTQWPDDAIKVTSVIVTILPTPPVFYPSSSGTTPQYFPNLGGGSPTPWVAAATYVMVDTTLSSPITMSVSPGDTVNIDVQCEYRLTAGGAYTPFGFSDIYNII